jgi:hypothetical protein
MATKDLSALPKQLGDVSSKLQELLGLFNSLNGAASQLGNTIGGAFGQTPVSSTLANSNLPEGQKQAIAQGTVVDISGKPVSQQQQADLKAAQDKQLGRNQPISNAPSQRMSESQAQNVFGNLGITGPITNSNFNPSSFIPQQQSGQKDIPRLIADLQNSSKLEAKASKEIERLKTDPTTNIAANAIQSTLKEFTEVTTELKKLQTELSKATAGSAEEKRLTQKLIDGNNQLIQVQSALNDSLKGSQRISGGGGGGGGKWDDFLDRMGGKFGLASKVGGGVLAAAKVGLEGYLSYQRAGIGYGQTIIGGEGDLVKAQSYNIGYQVKRGIDSRNLTDTDNLLRYQGDKILGSKMGYMLGDKGLVSALGVAAKEQNDKLELMRKEHNSQFYGTIGKIGIGLGAAVAGGFAIASAIPTAGASLTALPAIMALGTASAGAAGVAGGLHSAFSGAGDLYGQMNRGQYNLLTDKLDDTGFGFESSAGPARAALMQERYNEATRRAEELRSAQIDAYKYE